MRPTPILLIFFALLTSCAAPRLAREDAQRKIAELGTSRLIPDAVEIRRIDPQGENFAVVDSTVTLAFQFSRKTRNSEWEVAAIRLGDLKVGNPLSDLSDWINMSEILGAISGNASRQTPADIDAAVRTSQMTDELKQLLPSAPDISALTEERKRITELGESKLVPKAITIRRIISQSENQAIAESTVTLSFQFKRNGLGGQWYAVAVRLGEHNWINLNDLQAALNEGRRRDTTTALNELVAGMEAYRRANGSIPPAHNSAELADALYPQYMMDLVRLDAWGRALEYEVSGSRFRLSSRGPDGIPGTNDDIVVEGNASRTR